MEKLKEKKSKYVRETYRCNACCVGRVAGCIMDIILVPDHEPIQQGCLVGNNTAFPKAKWKKVNKKEE